jgi:integrase
MNITRNGPIKIGIKDIERAWRSRAKDARHIITDRERPGLALIVNTTSMSWSYSYKPRGADPETGKRFNTKAVTLGSPATLSPDQARAAANRLRDAVTAGGDPAAERKAEIAEAASQRAATVERAVADYLAVLPGKEKKGGGRISERWATEQATYLRRAIEELGVAKSSLDEVSVATVRELQRSGAYRHLFGTLNRFLDWCVHEDRIPANPCASIGRAFRPSRGGRRERTPTLREIATIWLATETALDSVSSDFVRFSVSTPARRGEIAGLRWEHLSLDDRIWEQPGRLTKNGDPHSLWLNDLALEILVRRHRAAGRPREGLVFPSRAMTPLSAFSGMLRALHRAIPAVERFALHDFRRSFATALGRLGEDDEATIDAVLNHRQSGTRGGVLGVYNRARRFPAQHAALERWGALVADPLTGRFPDDTQVIPLARRARS